VQCSEHAEVPGHRGNAQRWTWSQVVPSPFLQAVHLRVEAGNTGPMASAGGIEDGPNAVKRSHFISTFLKSAPSGPPHAVPSLEERKDKSGPAPSPSEATARTSPVH
jgi:hypothetical protein